MDEINDETRVVAVHGQKSGNITELLSSEDAVFSKLANKTQ